MTSNWGLNFVSEKCCLPFLYRTFVLIIFWFLFFWFYCYFYFIFSTLILTTRTKKKKKNKSNDTLNGYDNKLKENSLTQFIYAIYSDTLRYWVRTRSTATITLTDNGRQTPIFLHIFCEIPIYRGLMKCTSQHMNYDSCEILNEKFIVITTFGLKWSFLRKFYFLQIVSMEMFVIDEFNWV